jgi:hypothetical protein
MNYFAARQRKDGRWDYTCRNDDFIYPVGYCSKYREPDPKKDYFWTENSIKKYQAEKEFHHEEGHTTAEEARECYTKYLLDTTLTFGHFGNVWHKCEVCGELTDGYAQVDHGSMYDLCDKHQTREVVAPKFGTVGEIWSS